MKIYLFLIFLPIYVHAAIGVGYSSAGHIPVELTSFTANFKNENVVLSWQTATELNNAGFDIERSYDMQCWNAIGYIQGNGTTTEISNYSFVDFPSLTFQNIYYRLKQNNFDGTYSYSSIIAVTDKFTPTEFLLNQNYPNPFNPTTTIEFFIPTSNRVTLKVYDILGREVAELLIDVQKEAGKYVVEFDATSLSSGTYIYRLTAGTYVSNKKMIVVK
ncbi:MAG: T9SS type A sorting domain-containing protein [bacterium]